jgi:hypothetical protein
MDYKTLAALLSKLPPGILCTSNGQGEVSGAVFGSARLLADGRLILGLSHNRTLKNLQLNPEACYISYAPGEILLNSKGIRLYLKLDSLETQGNNFDETVSLIEKNAGKYAAKTIKNVAIFAICSSRPLIDFN